MSNSTGRINRPLAPSCRDHGCRAVKTGGGEQFFNHARLKPRLSPVLIEYCVMLRSLATLLLVASLGLAGCAHRALPNLSTAGLEETYRLASGDRLRIIVFGQESLSNSYALDGAGRLSFPLVGLVAAGGLTTPELERALEARLRNGFLRDPKVAVEIEQYRPFFILGEVVQAGQYPFVNGGTIQTAVAIAGGFTPRANRHVAEVTRSIDGELVTGTISPNDPIRPGDTIVIRERFF